MYDYSELNGKMKSLHITQCELANNIGISEFSLNKKLNNKSQFNQNEMKEILKNINEDLSEIVFYFYQEIK